MNKPWPFMPSREFTVGSIITGGDVYGMVQENELINHLMMFYPGKHGRITVSMPLDASQNIIPVLAARPCTRQACSKMKPRRKFFEIFFSRTSL
jgi:hypothetical protein